MNAKAWTIAGEIATDDESTISTEVLGAFMTTLERITQGYGVPLNLKIWPNEGYAESRPAERYLFSQHPPKHQAALLANPNVQSHAI